MKNWVNKIVTRLISFFSSKTSYYLMLIVFAFFFVISVNQLLTADYYVGSIAVVSYNKNFSWIRLAVSLFSVIISGCVTTRLFAKNDCASLTINILYIIYAVPLILSYSITKQRMSISFLLFFLVYWILLCIISNFVIYKIRIQAKKITALRRRIHRSVYICLIVVFVVYMVSRQSGFHIATELVSGTYQQRAAYKESNPGIWAYMKLACGGFVCPTLIAYYIKKNKRLSMLFMFLQVLLFSLAREKSYFFLIIISIIIGLLANRIEGNYRKMPTIIAFAYALVCILSLLGFSRTVLFEVLVRREMFMPAWINYMYYDFFSTNSPIWWRQDTFLVDKLFSAPYTVTASKLIDQAFFQGMVGNPNAGMFAEAISRCGLLGIIIYPFIYGILFKTLNYVTNQSTPEIKIMFAYCLSILMQNDTVTSTGFVIAAVLMFMLSLMFSEKKDCIVFRGFLLKS